MFKTCSQKWDNLVFQNEMRNMSSAFRVWAKASLSNTEITIEKSLRIHFKVRFSKNIRTHLNAQMKQKVF